MERFTDWILLFTWRRYDTQDSLYDTTWSEAHENQIVVACGDGSVKLFDIGVNDFPVRSWQEHNREVYAVSWNLVAKDTFVSSSWDGTVKLVSKDHSPGSPSSDLLKRGKLSK